MCSFIYIQPISDFTFFLKNVGNFPYYAEFHKCQKNVCKYGIFHKGCTIWKIQKKNCTLCDSIHNGIKSFLKKICYFFHLQDPKSPVSAVLINLVPGLVLSKIRSKEGKLVRFSYLDFHIF